MPRILFLNPPSSSRFDSAGARYQSIRKAKTMWLPTWLAYGAAVAETEFEVSLVDSPAEELKLHQLIERLSETKPQLVVMYTSTPSMPNDINVCREICQHLSETKVVLVGPHVTVLPEQTLRSSEAVWGVARGEFVYSPGQL